jgi:hypothetical protein
MQASADAAGSCIPANAGTGIVAIENAEKDDQQELASWPLAPPISDCRSNASTEEQVAGRGVVRT